MASRKDKQGKALQKGEYERKGQRGYIYKWRDAYGIQCSVSALTLPELREKEKDVKIGQIEGRLASQSHKTVNEYYNLWLKQKKRSTIKDNVLSNYVYMYDKYVAKSNIGKKQVASLKKSDVVNFYGDLIHKTGLSVNTVDNTIHTVLRQVLQICVEDDVIRKNPCEGAIKGFKGTVKHKGAKALTPDEQQLFLDTIKGTQWECIFGFMLLTGLRVAEVSALRWDDIDYDKGLIHIQRNFVYYRDQLTDRHKGDALMDRKIQTTKSTAGDRLLPINAEIERLLSLYKEIGNVNTDVVESDEGPISGFVFATRDGRCYNQSSLNRALKRIMRDANNASNQTLLPDLHCHLLRKTYCSNLARSGVSLVVAGRLMGHSPRDLETTNAIYTEVQQDMLTNADNLFMAYLNSEQSKRIVKKSSDNSTQEDGDANESHEE